MAVLLKIVVSLRLPIRQHLLLFWLPDFASLLCRKQL